MFFRPVPREISEMKENQVKKLLLAVASCAAASVSTYSRSAVVFSDDFESYADSAAMQSVWTGTTGTLSTTGGYAGSQAMEHPGGTSNIYNMADDLIPDESQNVVLKGKIYDDGAGNKRISIGFRSLSTFPLFEMGMYNGPTNYAYRVTLFPGANPSWIGIPTDPNPPVIGWNEFTATFSLESVLVTIDYGSDGTIDATSETLLSGDAYTTGLGSLRLGGPSGVSSAGGGAFFDDISVETVAVPEPATMSALAVGLGVTMTRRRRK